MATIPYGSATLEVGSCGDAVTLYPSCVFVQPERMHLGSHVIVSEFVWLHAGVATAIGSFVHLANHASIAGGGVCVLEDFVGLSAGARIVTGSELVHGEEPIGPGPILHADTMDRAAIHGRPLVNGLHGYWPHEFPARMALACRLPDPTALATLRQETGLELLLVHLAPLPIGRPVGPYACPPRPAGAPTDVPDAPRDPAPWEALARAGREDVELVLRDGSDLLFRVRAGR